MAVRSDFASRSRAVFIVTTVTFILATAFVIARLISRFVLLRNRTWDDWLMILAWVGHFCTTRIGLTLILPVYCLGFVLYNKFFGLEGTG